MSKVTVSGLHCVRLLFRPIDATRGFGPDKIDLQVPNRCVSDEIGAGSVSSRSENSSAFFQLILLKPRPTDHDVFAILRFMKIIFLVTASVKQL